MARARTTVLMLVAASLGLILWDLRASDEALRSSAQQVVTPLQRTVTALFAPLGAWAADVREFSDPVVRERQAAAIAAPEGWKGSPARVVAADIGGSRAVVTIDAGSSAGVREGNAVLAPAGLVGQVRRVSPDSATVQLVSDPGSTIGVRVQPSGEMGVVTGEGMGRDLRLTVLNPAAEVRPDDPVTTLGSTQREGIPADVPLGTVAAVDTTRAESGREAEVSAVTGMTTLDTVLVLTERR